MEQLEFKSIHAIKTLLQENDLPVSDLNSNITFFVEKQNEKIIAVGGIEEAGKDAIIRSIAVADEHKGCGYGKMITRQLLNHAKEKGKKDIYLLTTTAEKYFPKYGFKEIDRHTVPNDVKNSSQYRDVCPDTAVVMKLDFVHNK